MNDIEAIKSNSTGSASLLCDSVDRTDARTIMSEMNVMRNLTETNTQK